MTDVATPPPLSPEDDLLWRIEADPVLRSTVLVVGLLDRAPGPRRLASAVTRACREVPVLSHRLAPPPLGLGRPAWRRAEVSLDHHVRRARIAGGGLDEVLALVAPDAAAPFDLERPPWSLTIVEGLDGGAAAFALRFHHAIADGVGALRLAHHLLDPTRRGPARRRDEPAPPDGGTTAGRDEAAPRDAGIAGAAARVVRAATVPARHPVDAVTAPTRLGRSLWRFLRPAPATGSPLLAGRGLDRALHARTVPLADLRAAAAAVDGTVNDVLLAAVSGAYRRYHERHGVTVVEMPTSIPVNRRGDDEPGGGNRFTMARLVLPVDDPDPATRARIAGAIVRRWRAEPALGATGVVAAGLDLLPPAAVARTLGALLRGIDLNVVDLRGLDGAAFLAGARVERLFAFAPTAGTACSVTLLSHGPDACVAVTADRAAITDPVAFVACLDEGLDEVVALGRPAAPDDDGRSRRGR